MNKIKEARLILLASMFVFISFQRAFSKDIDYNLLDFPHEEDVALSKEAIPLIYHFPSIPKAYGKLVSVKHRVLTSRGKAELDATSVWQPMPLIMEWELCLENEQGSITLVYYLVEIKEKDSKIIKTRVFQFNRK